jgi:multiple sugar transport system substrate-binding protein
MKRLWPVLLIAALLVACTPLPAAGPPAAAPAANSAAAEGVVTLRFAIWDANQVEMQQKSIDLFEAQHPNIKIEMEVLGGDTYWPKILAMLAGQDAYDVFWMDTYNFLDYASRNAMLDLTPYIERDQVNMADLYGAGRMVNVTYEDQVYAVPKDSDDPALYYNKDLFDKYGVAYPTADWTWDDLQTMAAALTHPEDEVWGFSTGQFFGGPDWWNWVWQNGGEILTPDGKTVLLDQPAACDALKWWYGLVKAGYAPDGNIIQSADPTEQLFPTGKVAMLMYGQWMLSVFAKLPFNLGVAPLPAGPGGKAVQLGGLAYAAWSGTPHPAEAWEFVKFMGGEEAMKIQADSGVIIPALVSQQAVWAKSLPNLDLQGAFLDMMPYGKRPGFVGWEWNNEVNKVLTDAWSGNMSIDEACAAATEAGNAALNKRSQ